MRDTIEYMSFAALMLTAVKIADHGSGTDAVFSIFILTMVLKAFAAHVRADRLKEERNPHND